MLIETERLILRDYSIEDLQDFYRVKSCKEVWTYSTYVPLNNLEQAQVELEHLISKQALHENGFCALLLKESNCFIGEAGILDYNKSANRCVIGYNLLPSFWQKGYATEITRYLVQYAFEDMLVERVEALAVKENTESCRVLEKSGLILEGTLKHFAKINGSYHDICYYGLIRGEYAK